MENLQNLGGMYWISGTGLSLRSANGVVLFMGASEKLGVYPLHGHCFKQSMIKYDKSCWSKPTWFSDPLCDIMWYQAHSLASLKKWLRSWNDNGIWKLAHANMLASRPFYSPSPLHWPEVPPENHQNWGKAWVPGWKRTEMTQTPSISQFPRPETAEYVRVHGSCPGSWECSKLVTLQNSEVS